MKEDESKGRSFDELYERYYHELVLWADTILNNMGEAEDLVQDLFVHLWEKKLYEELRGETVRSYLYVSVRNMALRRREGGKKTLHLPDLKCVERVWEEDDLSHKEMLEKVLDELERMPGRSREILECVHLKNMTYAETAEWLGIGVPTVKTLLVRSLKQLRDKFSSAAFLLYMLVRKRDSFFVSKKIENSSVLL